MQLTQTHVDYWHKNLMLTAILLVIWFVATFILAWFALNKLGAVEAPINTAYRGDEVSTGMMGCSGTR